MREQTSESGLEILSKADLILSALVGVQDRSVAEIAEAASMPVSSTYRLVGTLSGFGWVEQSSRGRYRLGLELLRIGAGIEHGLDVRQRASDVLRALSRELELTAFLCIRRDGRAVCIDRAEGPAVQSLALQLGSSLPLHAGAAPRAILAHLPEVERRWIGEHPTTGLEGDPPAPSWRALDRALGVIRSSGFSSSDEDVTPGIAAIGAPIRNHRGEVAASISVSGLRSDVKAREERVIAAVVSAADAISAELGWEGRADG